MTSKYKPLWVTPELHRVIKSSAAAEGKTINAFLKKWFIAGED